MVIGIHAKLGAGKDLTGKIIQALTLNDEFYTKYPDQIKWDTAKFPNSNFTIQKFAEELKQTVCRWIGCTREQLEDSEFKNKELGEEWWYYQIQDGRKEEWSKLIPYVEGDEFIKSQCELIKLTPRKLLQLLGTEAGRDIIHPDLWVNILFSKYQPETSKWVITDLRFPNEFKRIKKVEGINIKITRPIDQRFPREWDNFISISPGRNEEQFLEYLRLGSNETEELYKTITHYSETALDNCNDFDYVIENNGTIEELIGKIREILVKENIIKM